MTNFITPAVGKTYNPNHLRPFDLELAKAGHPLAWYDGSEISHFFDGNQEVVTIRVWEKEFWSCIRINKCFLKKLCLAPLAVKDGKPLHVGDVIFPKYGDLLTVDINFVKLPILENNWRWPVEVES